MAVLGKKKGGIFLLLSVKEIICQTCCKNRCLGGFMQALHHRESTLSKVREQPGALPTASESRQAGKGTQSAPRETGNEGDSRRTPYQMIHHGHQCQLPRRWLTSFPPEEKRLQS